jgi:hypothetical protein
LENINGDKVRRNYNRRDIQYTKRGNFRWDNVRGRSFRRDNIRKGNFWRDEIKKG